MTEGEARPSDPYSWTYVELLQLLERIRPVPDAIDDLLSEALDTLWFALGDEERKAIEDRFGKQHRVTLHRRRLPL